MKLDQNYNEIEKFEVNSTSFPGHESGRKQDGTYSENMDKIELKGN